MIDDALKGSADGAAGTRAPGLITWRDTGQKGTSHAYLGEFLVGGVWDCDDRAAWELFGLYEEKDLPDGEAPTEAAARAALSAAVAEWTRRAGLVGVHTPERRFNIEERDGELWICRGDHESGHGCEFQIYRRSPP